MNDRPVSRHSSSIWTLAFAGLAALFATTVIRYATKQSLWTDEATQMSGLSLSLTDQLRWLIGRLPDAFAVPPDRTPPLSYWLGSLWTRAFGHGVMTARFLSVVLSFVSVTALWATARRFLDVRKALVCAALLAFSPNFLVEASEIRAYAAFALTSIVLIYAYLRLLDAKPHPSDGDLWAFALAGALCSYTHFFGVVITAGACVCVLAFYVFTTTRIEARQIAAKAGWPVLFYTISVLGLLPFILASVKNSGDGDVTGAALTTLIDDRIHGLAKLIYRFFGHQSMLGVPGLSALALLAGITLVVSSVITGSGKIARQMLLFLLVNLVLITLVGLGTHAFNAFASSYNLWALPALALIATGGLAHQNRHARIACTLSIGVLLAADGYASMRMATAGEIYGHTRSAIVKAAIEKSGAEHVVVLYANDAPSIYFAMMYDYGPRLRQYIDRGSILQSIGGRGGSPAAAICALHADTLLVVQDQQLSAVELQSLIEHPTMHTGAHDALDRFLALHQAELGANWRLTSREDYLAQSALALAIFERRTGDVAPDSTPCGPAGRMQQG